MARSKKASRASQKELAVASLLALALLTPRVVLAQRLSVNQVRAVRGAEPLEEERLSIHSPYDRLPVDRWREEEEPRRTRQPERLRMPASQDRLSVYRERRRDEAESGREGFFPTKMEWERLGNYYPRIEGDSAGGAESDPRGQAPSGLWPYPSGNPEFHQRNPSLLPFADPFLGFFAPPGNGLTATGQNRATGFDATIALDNPFFTRAFNPERATLKLGLIYLDVLALTGTVLYSDYQGPQTFARDEDDGWLAAISLSLRVVIPITPSIYLSAAGEVYYLPFSNKVGFAVGDVAGIGLGTGLRLVYEKYFGGWWVGLTSGVSLQSRFIDYTDRVSVGEIETAGRYRFGREDTENRRRGNFFSNNEQLFVVPTVLTAVGPLGPFWRMSASLGRTDVWTLDGFDYLGANQFLSAIADYQGQDWRFAPFVGYTASTNQDFESIRHEIFAGLRGPITQQLTLYTRAGYSFLTGERRSSDSVLGEIGLIHEVGPYTHQSLFAGYGVTEVRRAERTLGNYVRYTLDQRFSHRLFGNFYAQIAQTKNDETGESGDQFTAGATLQLTITDYSQLTIGASYDRVDRETTPLETRFLLSAQVSHRILPGVNGTLLYQYEDVEYADFLEGFQEHLVLMSVTKFF